MKKLGIIVIVLLVLATVAYIVGMPMYQFHFAQIKLNADEKTIYIPSGSSLAETADLIGNSSDGSLSSDQFLEFADEFGLTEEKIESGKYQITDGMKVKNLIYGLKNGNQEIKDVRITFNNCEDIYEVAGKVAPGIEADSAEIVNYILAPQTIDKYGFRENTIMALFLPDTYEVGEWDISAEEFVQRMADEYKKFWTDERKQKASQIGLGQSEAATLASIIEAEQGINTVEWKTIAGLYLNRLNINMPLQSDPTAKFCWGDELDGVQRLLRVHMQRDCPYNTYLYGGLPPGPIRIPSKKAIDAVLNAEDHKYLYMCAKPDNSGLHNFAETLRQHNVNASKWQAYARARGY